MGDSAVAEVTGEVVMEQASSTQTVTKRSVTSIQTTHIQSSHESSVRVESVVQGGTAEQTFAVESVVQGGSVGQSLAVESSHVEAIADIPKEEAPPVEESQPEPEPQPAEPQPVDENANAIPEEQEAQPQQEQAEEHAPEEHKAEEQEPVPAVAEEVPAEAESVPAEEPAAEASADAEISQENIKSQLHEIISEIEEQVQPEHDEVHKDEVVESQQVDVAVTPAEETPPVEEAPASEEAVEAPAQEVEEAVEAPPQEVEEVVEAPAPEVEEAPAPVVEEAPAPVVEEAPAPVVEEAPAPEVEAAVEAPAQEVVEVPAQEVEPVEEEDGVLHHTWRPKGKYELQKTAITYEDVVPIAVPEVSLKEPEPKPAPQPQPQQLPEQMPQVMQEPMHNGDMSPQVLSPLEIPEGIPLLARILPKVDGEGDKKISLERLFTPATDSGDLTPKKASSRKMYSSSAFYRPDHPTIDDQVELAQRISFSLVDDNNKMSRGQSMYLKRKNRSMRWIHQGSGAGGEMPEEEMQRPLEKPPMKLLMNPKGVQDFQAVQEHYENLMNAPTSPDVGKIVVQSPVIAASPSGKGAELFAKRKKRMDKFIVDETTVQKAQQQTTSVQQTSSFSSSFSSSSKSVSSSSSFTSMKQAEMERNRQQEQIMFAAPPMGGAPTAPAAAPASGPFNLPELTKILTQPPKSEFSKSKTESSELNPVASKTSLVARKARSGNTLTSQQPRRAEAHAHLPPYPLARNPILVPAPPAVSTCLLQTSAQSFLSSCPCPSSALPCLSAKNPNINDNTSNAAAICPKTVCSPRIQPGSLTSLQLFKISECLKSSSASSVPPEKSSLPESVVSPGGSRDNNVTAGDKQLSNSFSSTPISASNVISAPLTVTTSPLSSAAKNAFDCNTVLQSFHPQSTLPVSECASLSTCMPPSLAVTTAFSLSAAPRENICSGKSALPASTAALSLSVTSTIVTPASFSVASISDVQHFTSAVATSIAIAVSSGNALQASSAQNCTFTTPLSVKAQPLDSLSSYSLAPSKLKPGMKCDPTSVLPNPDEQNQYHSTKLTPPPLSHSNINFDSPEDSSLIQVDQEASLSNIEDLDPKIIYINTQACSNITNQGNQIIQSNQINCADENTCELKVSNHTSDNRPLRPTSLPLIPMSQLVNSVVPHSHGTPAQSLLSTPPSALHSLLPDVNGAGQNTVTSSGSTACCTVDSTSFSLEQSPHCKNTFTQTLHTPIMSVVKTVPNVAPPEGSQVTLAGQSVKLPSALVLPKGSICPPASMIVSPDSRRSPSPTGRQKDDTVDGNFDELGTPYCFVKCKTQATPYICKQQTQIEASHAPDCETFIGMSKVESQMSFGSESEQSDYSVSLMDDEELENIEVAVPEIRIAHIHRPSINETELRKYLGELEDMFKQNPDEVSSITVDDLKPPDFYRCVSRTSLNQEVEDGESLLIDDDSHGSKSNLTVTPFAQLKVDMSHDQRLHSEEQSREEASPLPSSKCAATNLSNVSKRDGDESGERERQSAPAVAGREGRESGGQREKKDTEQICSSVDEERSTMEACKDISQPFESPWLRSASPPVFPSSKDTNPPTPSAGTGAIYTAEVKVVQRASLPPTPVDIPQHSLLDLVEQDSNVNKRRSLNFNLAAKGFGTYNNFYTPVTFAT